MWLIIIFEPIRITVNYAQKDTKRVTAHNWVLKLETERSASIGNTKVQAEPMKTTRISDNSYLIPIPYNCHQSVPETIFLK